MNNPDPNAGDLVGMLFFLVMAIPVGFLVVGPPKFRKKFLIWATQRDWIAITKWVSSFYILSIVTFALAMPVFHDPMPFAIDKHSATIFCIQSYWIAIPIYVLSWVLDLHRTVIQNSGKRYRQPRKDNP